MWGISGIGYRVLGSIALLVAVFTAGAFIGYRGPHNALLTFRAQVAQEAADQARIAKAKDAENERIKQEAENDYQTTLINNTNYWHQRLLHSQGCSSTVSTNTAAASGVDETTSNSFLPPYNQLVLDCAATTVQLEALQKWVKETR